MNDNRFHTFTLPFPVSVNALYGGGSGQQRFKSKKYKAWLASCPYMPPLNLPLVTIHYMLYFPDHRPRDAENFIKCCSDFLVAQRVIADDNWTVIQDMRITPCGVDKINPRVVIFIVDKR